MEDLGWRNLGGGFRVQSLGFMEVDLGEVVKEVAVVEVSLRLSLDDVVAA